MVLFLNAGRESTDLIAPIPNDMICRNGQGKLYPLPRQEASMIRYGKGMINTWLGHSKLYQD